MDLVVIEALKHYGLSEIIGSPSNERILAMVKAMGYPFKSEEIPWCGTFLAYCCHAAGVTYPDMAYRAQNWMNWGREVPVEEVQIGDVVILWRDSPTSGSGHVALFMSFMEGRRQIYLLGGNQSNQVNISPFLADRVFGYRRAL